MGKTEDNAKTIEDYRKMAGALVRMIAEAETKEEKHMLSERLGEVQMKIAELEK